MICIFALSILNALLVQAQSEPATPKQQPAPRVAASKPDPKPAPAPKRHPDGRPLGIPYSAVKISDGAWRAVEDGKPIIYRTTAFGFTKVSEEDNGKIQRMINGKPDESTEVPVGLSVTEEGDRLRFKRITPFGPYEWVKAKTDLTAVEKAAWNQTKGTAKH